ncbi:Rox3 mediator complex subunit-domain-containing protein [Ampelomyces quisqualis]|uniref:Mediator of RNA polymerase II transcription subunit 19 n=1 Tax=Ampelomyces quisqualis TaxID=50730 RepID=A0A6A5Q8K8_AMPQU|nr:Rox3 mediator complex subunit-domain-containing protein [Ampelomyces quisqualis]
MSEHTAKRQRLDSTGRFSPASPPFDVVAKASGHTKTSIHPRTPTSPPFLSMTSQANGGPASSTATALSDRSPPSSNAMSQSLSHSNASASMPHPFPTPVSTTSLVSSMAVDSDGDATMEDHPEDEAASLGRRTLSNHDRQGHLEFSARGGLKAAEGVSGGQLFRVAQSQCDVSRPHAAQNLFRLYSLESLARSVARTDPATGEKINKLRKSYEGHIKSMQIAGKPKAQKMEGLFSLPLSAPPEEWTLLKVQGKEMGKALNAAETALDPGFGNLLDNAFAGMTSGQLPTADATRYRTYIGTEDVVKPKPQDGPPQRPTPHTSAAPTPGNAAAARGVSRPERSGSKRHYTDAAFQGYGEGYNDDFGADSTGGEDNTQGNMAKRRKLQFERTSHPVEVGGVRR